MDRKKSSITERMVGSRHIDTMGPKKELERAERQLELVKRESKKTYEREKRQMERKISQRVPTALSEDRDPRDPRTRNISTISMTHKMSMAATSQDSMNAGMDPRSMQGVSRDASQDFPVQHQLTAAEKQADALRQMRYLHEVVLAMIKEAQIQVAVHEKGETQPGEMRRAKISTVSWRSEAYDDDSKVPVQISRRGSSTAEDRKTSRRYSRAYTLDVSEPGMDTQVLPSGTTTPLVDDFLGPPLPAVEMICMAKMLCMGRNLDTKQIKALTSVLEECRYAVKSIKGGMDSERALERLVRRLTELLELVKPWGADLLISPAEILRCSYLRLSPENIETMERMMLDQGLSPGIHSHTKVESMSLQELRELEASVPAGSNTADPPARSNLPVPVFQTKAGVPLSKRRISRPDGGSMDDQDEASKRRERKAT